MIYTDLTKKAMWIAYDAHYGQVDRGGTPYICHPLHVADEMPDEMLTAVAILHDVLEDTEVTAEELLKEGIPEAVVEAVQLLTRNKEVPYAEYIGKIIASGNRAALRVKYADLCHNMDTSRAEHGKLPVHLTERYKAASARIQEALAKQEV